MKSLREHYSNILTTIMCAILIWFGTQVMETTVELAELRTEVLYLRKDLTDNKQAQEYIHKDFEQRLRQLEYANAQEE